MMDKIGFICAGSICNREDSIRWLKKQLRNPKWNLDKKRQIQESLNLVKQMSEEQFRYEVDKYINQTFYQNNIWK